MFSFKTFFNFCDWLFKINSSYFGKFILFFISNVSNTLFKNSIFTNKRIYFVYCKAVLNNEKKVFKSIGFKDKPKPLNDTSKIKVYVDNNNHYLVNIYDLI